MSAPLPDCYDTPGDYALAFDFRDLPAEVAVVDRLRARFAPGSERSVLHLACGPAQHLSAFAAAGYRYAGLDLSAAMLAYARQQATALGIEASFHRASMVDFALDQRFGLIFIALGDLYVRDATEMDRHLDAVAAALEPGGLFLLDWCVQFQPDRLFDPAGQAWTIERDGVQVDACVTMTPVSAVAQSFDEALDLTVIGDGAPRHSRSVSRKYALYPQQFLRLIDAHPALEFCGWWNNWDPDAPLDDATTDIYRPIALVRRTDKART